VALRDVNRKSSYLNNKIFTTTLVNTCSILVGYTGASSVFFHNVVTQTAQYVHRCHQLPKNACPVSNHMTAYMAHFDNGLSSSPAASFCQSSL
jgi:hypothetical protein